MRRILLVVVICLLVFVNYSFACDCGAQGNFLDLIHKESLVIHVKVLAYYGKGVKGLSAYIDNPGVLIGGHVPLAMDVEIKEVLYGKEQKKRIRVWGDDGVLCRPYVTKFPKNTEWILNVDKVPSSKIKWEPRREKAGDYAISVCGEHWLALKDRKIIGEDFYSFPKTEMSYEEFKQRILILGK